MEGLNFYSAFYHQFPLDLLFVIPVLSGRGNPKFKVLYLLITYLKIPVDKIFYPNVENPAPECQKLMPLLND